MSTNESWLLEQKLEALEQEKLLKVARDLQLALREKTTETSELRSKLSKTENEMKSRSQTSEAEISKQVEKQQKLLSKIREQELYSRSQSTPKWIRAELDYPEDVSWFCFSRKAQTVLVYDSSSSTLEARSIETLHDERALISRVPSRRTRTIHVHVESMTTIIGRSDPRVRIMTKNRPLPGFTYNCTLHLNHLPLDVKFRILLGQIKWLFILRYSGDSRKSTGSSLGVKSSTAPQPAV